MRKKRNPAALKIANDIIATYKPESVEEMHEAIKEVFEPMFEAIQAKWRIISVTSSKSEKTIENRRLFRKEAQNVARRDGNINTA